MATQDKNQGGKFEFSRRDFLKIGAAAAAAGAVGVDFAVRPSRAEAAVVAATYTTTCPYCSAQCGQKVDVAVDGTVLDIYGDVNNPTSRGGLCSKGAGSYQLVTNPRRIGVPEHTAAVDGFNFTGTAWKRTGDAAWAPMGLDDALGEIGTKLVAARGLIGDGTVSTTLDLGTVTGVGAYKGFSGLVTIRKPDGTYIVTTNGNTKTPVELGALLAGPDIPGLVAAFDMLVFTASDPNDKSTYTYVGKGDLGAKMWAAGVMANTADIVLDAGVYYAYSVDASTGLMHLATSDNMLLWAYVGLVGAGKPTNANSMTSPSVLKNGDNLQVWFVDDPNVGELAYATFTGIGTVWSAATKVTVDEVKPTGFVGHPLVTKSGTALTLRYFVGGLGIHIATSTETKPAAFTAPTTPVVYQKTDFSQGNMAVARTGMVFTEYDYATLGSAIGWAYCSVKALVNNNYNASTVQFFGCSHMNNEPNYVYRKIVGDFGTSQVEHQARI